MDRTYSGIIIMNTQAIQWCIDNGFPPTEDCWELAERLVSQKFDSFFSVVLFIIWLAGVLMLVEQITKPEIINDEGESEGLDQYYEIEYKQTRDYFLASYHHHHYEEDW